MQGQRTPKIETMDQALDRLIEWQVEEGGVPTQPTSADTIETEAGWAFFNADRYFGTVTFDGEVIEEEQFVEEEES
jgi:hypothetical protein